MLEIEGILFDMDGVLVSSIASVRRCWQRWAEHYGVANADRIEIPHGTRAIDVMEQLKPGVDKVEGLRLIEDMEVADVADLRVLPGARELLASLPPERWTVVTSATRRLMLGRLEAAGLPTPERLITADMVVNGKPHPEPYQRGAAALGFAPANCLVIEDAPSGVRAGVGAGCPVLGVEGTYDPRYLREAGARWVVRSLEQVQATVTERGLEFRFEGAAAALGEKPRQSL